MKKVFKDKYQMECTFMDDGVAFCNSRREIFYPYGCLDSINMSLLGVMQAVSRAHVCCFAVKKEDKAEIKELLKSAKAAMKTAETAEPVVIDLESLPVDPSLAPQEQLAQFKSLYVQGVISKAQYDFKKKMMA